MGTFKVLISSVLIITSTIVVGQNSVGIGTTTPDANAVLDLQSTGNNQGLLVPRLTTAQRTAAAFIASLAGTSQGLVVYDTDLAAFQYWNGAAWQGLGGSDNDWIENNDTIYNNSHYVVVGQQAAIDEIRMLVVNNGTRTALAGSSNGNGSGAIGVEGFATGSDVSIGVSGVAESLVGDTAVGIHGTANGVGVNFAALFENGNVFVQNNLGISEGNPNARIHVNTGATNTIGLQLSSSGLGFGSGVLLDNVRNYSVYSNNGGDFVIGDETAGSGRFQINPVGNITFNNAYTFPNSDGAASQVLTTDGSGNVSWQAPGTDTDWITSGTNIYSGNTGNVGIGTSTPTSKLDIEETTATHLGLDLNQSNAGDYDARIRFQLGGVNEFSMGVDDADSDKFKIANGGNLTTNTRFTMLQSGSIGLGIDAPGSNLHIYENTTNTTPQFLIENAGTGDAGLRFSSPVQSFSIGIDQSDGDKFKIGDAGTLTTGNGITVVPGGAVGIGTNSPAVGNLLEIAGLTQTEDLRVLNGAGTIGHVLTSVDATGQAVWQPAVGAPDNDWLGAGTGDMVLGSIDDQVSIGVNNAPWIDVALYVSDAADAAYTVGILAESFDNSANGIGIWGDYQGTNILGKGVYGSSATGYGGYFTGDWGIYSTGTSLAAYLDGDVEIHGGLLYSDGSEALGSVLTSDAVGNATWAAASADWTLAGNAIAAGQILGTTNAQDLVVQAGGATAMTIDDVTQNIGIGALPNASYDLYVYRPFGDFGSNRHGIYSYREGNNASILGGTSWSPFGVDAAITGAVNYGNEYSAAIYGNSVLDYPNSASIVGNGGGALGALAYRDGASILWAGYFEGNIRYTGALNVNGNYGLAGQVLTSAGGGVNTWTTPLSLANSGIYGGSGTVPTTTAVTLTDNINFDANTFYIDGVSNRVGIGSATPSYPLHVYSAASSTGMKIESDLAGAYLYIDKNASTDFGFIGFMEGGADRWVVGNYAGGGATTDDFRILDWTNGSSTNTAFVIKNDGLNNVGIGTGTPVNRLDVEGSVAIGVTYSGTNTAPANGLIVEGSVGVGTAAPTEKLTIYDVVSPTLKLTSSTTTGITNAVNSGTIEMYESDGFVGATAYGARMYYDGLANLFHLNMENGATTNEAITIPRTTGYVGIGGISPTSPLDVNGNVEFSGDLRPNNLPGTSGQVLTSTGTGTAPTWTDKSGPSDAFFAYAGAEVITGSMKINMTAENFDDGNNFDLVNDEYVAPSNGFYNFHGQVQYDDALTPSGRYQIKITKNGIVVNLAEYEHYEFTAGAHFVTQISSNLSLVAGDRIQLTVYEGVAGTANTNSAFTGQEIYFTGYKLY